MSTTLKGTFPQTRLRRLRQSPQIRNLQRETRLHVEQLILPVFIRDGMGIKQPIASMPGYFQFSLDTLQAEIQHIQNLGIKNIILFGLPKDKNSSGSFAYATDGIIQRSIPKIKEWAPELLIISDLCFCEYTDHGHCGILSHQQELDNDATLAELVKQAISHARAGVDIIAPSGMIDGMVHCIREGLDEAGFSRVPILSYAVKYASSFYGPFREAAGATPSFGDRRSHQMDYANSQEALRECALDVAEGADMLMVKPAHTYLDVIAEVKRTFPELPLGAYHTSGEFSMIKAASEKGWMDEKSAMIEVLTAIRRAGADFIITYFAKEAAAWLKA